MSSPESFFLQPYPGGNNGNLFEDPISDEFNSLDIQNAQLLASLQQLITRLAIFSLLVGLAITGLSVAAFVLSLGSEGPPGKNGTNGKNGTDGTNGINGTNGLNGTDGVNGTILVNITNNSNDTNVTEVITFNATQCQVNITIGENGTFISTPGPPGPQGPPGPPGPQGDPGVNGTDGINGINGTDGTNGINGTDGTNGADGVNGTNGIDGVSPQIFIGNVTTGPPGSNVSVTNVGNSTYLILDIEIPQGEAGIDGTNGTNGINGTDGTNGIDGINGTNGINGINGTDGINGINGTDGTDGISPQIFIGNVTTGPPGSNVTVINVGNSTYLILDIEIPQGEPGLDGMNGMNGTDGTNGINGTDGTDGTNGTNGTDGIDGITPQIFIGDVTTGPPGSNVTVINVGNSTYLILDIEIPQGEPGLDGMNGVNGTDGTNGINGTDGTNGIDGINGTNGTDGTDGITPQIFIGTVNTGPPGSNASVINVGNDTYVILDITIPEGEPGVNGTNGIDGTNGINGTNGTNGVNGINGTDGTNGTSATITIGNVTTGAAGSQATVTNAGNSANVVLNFSIPQGAQGVQGPVGPQGPTGTVGASKFFTLATTSQSLTTVSTFQTANFTLDLIMGAGFGFTRASAPNITSGVSGNFTCYYSMHVRFLAGSQATIWATIFYSVGGTGTFAQVVGTAKSVQLSSTSSQQDLSATWIQTFASGDVMQLKWFSNVAQSTMVIPDAGAGVVNITTPFSAALECFQIGS